jgi:hypothetical protein
MAIGKLGIVAPARIEVKYPDGREPLVWNAADVEAQASPQFRDVVNGAGVVVDAEYRGQTVSLTFTPLPEETTTAARSCASPLPSPPLVI